MADPDPATVLGNVRKKYPQYADVPDDKLASQLATKYPKAYGFLMARATSGGARQVKPGERPVDLGQTQSLGQGIRNLPSRAGDIAANVAPMFVPGGGARAFAGRLLAAEAGQDIGDMAAGQKVTPGTGAGSQLVGEGVSAMAAPLLSTATMKSFANRTVKALAAKLDELVPSWKEFPATAKGLHERALGTGQRVLSKKFDEAVTGIKTALPPDLSLQVPHLVELNGKVFEAQETRNARALIDALPELRKAGGAEYRNALKALANQLPNNLSPELNAIRSEYKSGAGWIEFAEKGKFLKGEKYDPAKAQAALDTWGKKTLLGRGLDDIREIVRGPGKDVIEPVKHNPILQRIEGGLIGGAAALPFGLPHAVGGAAGGAISAATLPKITFKNVPLTPAQDFAGRVGRQAVPAGIREGARDFGFKEQLPGGVVPEGPDPDPSRRP